MATRYIQVEARPPAVYRGGTPGPMRLFYCQSAALTRSWGSEPATAELVYTGAVPVTVGGWLDIVIGDYVFHGNCVTDKPQESTSGHRRTLLFADNREFLDWDNVYAAFNLVDERVVSGRRIRRYKHLLPANYNAWRWTYTNSAYTAAQVLNFIFGAATVEDPWVRAYHVDQVNFPVLNLDWSSGARLKTVLTEISERQGLVFTQQGGRFRLEWARKGEGLLPAFPLTSDNREAGLSLSGHPTRMRILGDRNQYQVHGIAMVKDWPAAWESYYDHLIFEREVWRKGKLLKATTIGQTNYPAGTRFNAVSATDDPDQIVSRQLAKARALEITVAEFIQLLEDDAPGSGVPLTDHRKFQGRSRMEMPAALYLRNILFRAFRFPDGFTVRNAYGRLVPVSALTVAAKMVARVAHDPLTGAMSWDVTENPDGNGYAIVKGYQVGRDLFETIRPERFDLSQWNDAQEVWQRVPLQVDHSGEENDPFILFEEPVIKTADLVTMVDGWPVFRAQPTLATPAVRLAITFLGEKFSYIKGPGTRDDFENVPGLYAEFISQSGGAPVEVPYSDGLFANEKADDIATSRLNLQYVLYRGSYTNPYHPTNGVWPAAQLLTGMVDRINVTANPGGVRETVMLTTEAPRRYVPERDLDRAARMRHLLPGQAELRSEANTHRMIAAAVNSDARARKLLTDAFKGNIGNPSPAQPLPVKPPQADATLPAGTPLARTPGAKAVTPPEEATEADTELAGVTTREEEELTEGEVGEVAALLPQGEILTRVKGPVAAGGVVGLTEGADYLSAGEYHTVAGRARDEIEDDSVKLIRVQFGLVDVVFSRPTVVREYLHGVEVQHEGRTIYVLKPWHLRPVVEWEWPSHTPGGVYQQPASLPAYYNGGQVPNFSSNPRAQLIVRYLEDYAGGGTATVEGALRSQILQKFPTLTVRVVRWQTDDGQLFESLQEIIPRYRGAHWIEGGDRLTISPLDRPEVVQDLDISSGIVTPREIIYTHFDCNNDGRRWECLEAGRPHSLASLLPTAFDLVGDSVHHRSAVYRMLLGRTTVFYLDPTQLLDQATLGQKWEVDANGYVRIIQVPTS